MLKSLLDRISPWALLLTIISFGSMTFMPLAAQAEAGQPIAVHYQTPSGSTQLIMGDPAQPGRMEYHTKTQAEEWFGQVEPTQILQKNGKTTIYGTFRDSPGDSLNDKVFCTGDLVAIQTPTIDRLRLDVSWTVTGGQDCSEVGKQFKLKLFETRPVADARG
jgi:hypothetical protein